jgi:hypothetical protein
MNLVKWLRKNNKKMMAVVVIVIMFGFIGSDYLQWIGRGRTTHQTVAYFLDNKKIISDDLAVARRELEILKMLRADDILRSQDLGGILLAELLFAERRASPALTNHIKQTIRTNDYRVSDKQISDIYVRSMPSHIYWLLLENEVKLVGIRISNEEVGNFLGQAIPQLFNGQSYPQFVGFLIKQHGIPEELILTTFGKLLAVLQYAQVLCSNEIVTGSQIMHIASWENETIDVEFVKFDSAVFAESLSPPPEEKMLEHFDRYKKFFPGTVTEENPYGFGYKSPDRVQLEYIALKLSDISPTVTTPTQEEIEEYYQKGREQLFTEQVPSDPNDPNSPLVKRTKSYAEVANIISKQLLQNKIISKAEKILQEAKTITETNWKDTDAERTTLSPEQLKAMAGDYEPAARQLTEKYKIKAYTGQTGLLSAADMQTDKNLTTLYFQGYGYSPVRLMQVVFAINELGNRQLVLFDMPRPKLYENIGPATNQFGAAFFGRKDLFEQIMALVRVIKAVKASEPESINQTFSTKTLEFLSHQEPNEADPNSNKERSETQHIYSVKEKVAEDLKKLAAMDTTKAKAEEFIHLAAKDGWDNALLKFNEQFPRRPSQNESEPNAFELQSRSSLRRISASVLQTLAVQNAGSPMADLRANDLEKETQFRNHLYSLVPPDSNAPPTLPLVTEFKPDMSFYCLKNLSVNRLWEQDYEKIKARRLFKEDYSQAQSLAAVHFSPENILKRMNFREVDKEKEIPKARPDRSEESEPVTE